MTGLNSPGEISSQAQAAYQRGDYALAASQFKAAASLYLAAKDPLKAAEMQNNASVGFLMAGDADAALVEVEGTPEIFLEAGDIRRQAMAVGNRAAALDSLKRVDEALEAYEHSADLFKQIGENDLRLHAIKAMSALQLESGRRLQALASMKAGLDDLQKPTPKQRFLKRLLEIPFHIGNK